MARPTTDRLNLARARRHWPHPSFLQRGTPKPRLRDVVSRFGPVAVRSEPEARRQSGDYAVTTTALLDVHPPHLDVLVASGRRGLRPSLKRSRRRLALPAGFPARIPEDALTVPRHGVANGNPALLPPIVGRR
jgi:hypothetical protein